MELAFAIGINIAEFWDITPYELRVALRGYNKRKESEFKEYEAKLVNEKELFVYQALLISRWVWAKEISQSAYEEAIGRKRKPKVMTDEQMLNQVKMLNQMFGGEIVNGKE